MMEAEVNKHVVIPVDLGLEAGVTASSRTRSRRGVSLYFKDVVYEVKPEKKGFLTCGKRDEEVRKEILHGVSGYVQPGELLAVMGPSGSGKTTLLNVLAGRLGQPSSGELLFGGRARDRRTRRKVAYVTQEDLFFSNLTVSEILTFTARVRLPDSMALEEKDGRVVEVMKKLNLMKTANTKIGDGLFNKGVSGGERKRVGIANELLTDPSVLLLDEPTSGLDSNTALTVVRLMKGLALEGKTVVSTIHQPSSQMFAEFDKLLLLSDGHIVYFGQASEAYKYFASLGFNCPFGYNLADFFLQLLTEEDLNSGDPIKKKLVAAWKIEEEKLLFDNTIFDDEESSQRGIASSIVKSFRGFAKRVGSVSASVGEGLKATMDSERDVHQHDEEREQKELSEPVEKWGDKEKYVTSWGTQFRNLSRRAFLQKRGSILETWPIVQVCCTIFLVGVVWFRMEPIAATVQDRIGNLFFTCVFWAFFTMLSATYTFPAEKAVVRKDRAAGAYRLSAYFMAKSTMDVPLDIVYPTFYGVIVYWMVGLNPRADRFFIYMLLLITSVVLAQSAGLCISAATMNAKKATVLASILILASMMVAGYYVSTDNLPSWIRWLQKVSFIVYSFSAFIVNEFDGQTYPGNPTITDEDVFDLYDLSFNLGVWGNYGVMLLYIVLFRLLAYLFLRFFHKKHKKA